MNKKLLIWIFAFVLLTSFVSAADRLVEDKNYKIECDKSEYRVIGGTSYAYCNITNLGDTRELDLDFVLQKSIKANIVTIDYLNASDEYESLSRDLSTIEGKDPVTSLELVGGGDEKEAEDSWEGLTLTKEI
ncbi:hypothetical protein KY343_06640, partial [Candidatus Woesearchaeota archaeon]|nr:hypothetical protein [Candidatus Woesearchaeota archaeon]